MIHIEPLPPGEHAWVYIFIDDNAVFNVDDYDGIATLRWEGTDTCWISALKTEREGPRQMSRRVWRQLVRTLMGRGIRWVRAKRAVGRILPRAEKLDDGTFRVDLHVLEKPHDKTFAPLPLSRRRQARSRAA